MIRPKRVFHTHAKGIEEDNVSPFTDLTKCLTRRYFLFSHPLMEEKCAVDAGHDVLCPIIARLRQSCNGKGDADRTLVPLMSPSTVYIRTQSVYPAPIHP